MGTSPSNTLDLSVSDPAGHEYSVEFNGESFASGKHRKCYIATLSNEKAPKHNKKVVLKVFKPEFVNKYAFDYECVKDLERSITCHELSIKFNKTMEEYQSNGESIPISFPAPLRINIKRGKELTDKLISKVFNNIPIQIKSHKYLTVQLYLKNTQQYNYQKISSNNGWFDKTNHNYQFLSAFSHFSWVHTKGKMLINGFQGMPRGNVLFLSDAVIHSNVIGSNGQNDLGIIGIVNFFLNHKCTVCCKDLPALNTTLLMDYLSKNSILSAHKSTTYLNEINKTDLVNDEKNILTVYQQSIQQTLSEQNIKPKLKPVETCTEAGNMNTIANSNEPVQVIETIDKMEQIESMIDTMNNNNNNMNNICEFVENERQNIQNAAAVVMVPGPVPIEEEQFESDQFIEREGDMTDNSSYISDIDDFDNEELIQQIQNEENNMEAIHIINPNMDVSWFADNEILNDSYAEQKQLYDLDAINNTNQYNSNNSANDEWEFV